MNLSGANQHYCEVIFMEYIRRALNININPAFLGWCLALPAAAFLVALLTAPSFSHPSASLPLSSQRLREFLSYYDIYRFKEFAVIFGNNFLAVVTVVYFTPLALSLRRVWERLRGRRTEVSMMEKNLLFLFPGLFLVRQAVYIALASCELASQIGRNVVITMIGIILPHGIPEFLVFSLAGAVGMEVTRKALTVSQGKGLTVLPDKAVSSYTLGVLASAVAACALVEVCLTPKVFAVLMA